MPEEEMAMSADARARRKGLPKELRRGGGRDRRGRQRSGETEGRPGWRATSREDGDDDSRGIGEAAQAAGGGGDTTSRWRGRVSGGFPAKRRRRRGRGSGCDAGGDDGTAGRSADAAAGAAGGQPAPEREKEKAGRRGEATGDRGRGLKRVNGVRGFHFIGEERDPGTGEVGTAAEKSAGGHQKRPGLARPFPAIGGTIQGEN
uniref:Transposon protein, putative, unclassified n=2 Tax=Oryza sativa subsp. japonica TaxID=39947 RepID=Q6AV72_ORYSJ|nr:hypothetical protein [Oryza sativa Japonica Group]ABF96888.1 transposon protein, putative, unclassified [Oryza sativa Japonica Group]